MALPASASDPASPLSATPTPGLVDLAGWGLARVAYIRQVGSREWSILAADRPSGRLRRPAPARSRSARRSLSRPLCH